MWVHSQGPLAAYAPPTKYRPDTIVVTPELEVVPRALAISRDQHLLTSGFYYESEKLLHSSTHSHGFLAFPVIIIARSFGNRWILDRLIRALSEPARPSRTAMSARVLSKWLCAGVDVYRRAPTE